MPERSVLEALANTAQWVDWPRHLGLPSRLHSGIEDLQSRYVIATFGYGCGLGATQTARHFGGRRCHRRGIEFRGSAAHPLVISTPAPLICRTCIANLSFQTC